MATRRFGSVVVVHLLALRRAAAVLAAVALLWGAFASRGSRAEFVDSGWATGSPIAGGGAAPVDFDQQLLLRSMLEASRPPSLLGVPPADAAGLGAAGPAPGASGPASMRFVARPDGIEGWRPGGQASPVWSGSWRAVVRDPDEDEDGAGEASWPDAAPVAPAGEAGDEEPADDGASRGAEAGHGARVESAGPVAEELQPLTPPLVALRARVRSVLRSYYRRPLNSLQHDPWEVMHGMLAYGVQSRVRAGSPRGEPVTAVGWLCYNKPCKGMTLLHLTQRGELRARYGVGLQGHLGQFLALLAQCRVSADYPIRVAEQDFTIHDLVEAEKLTCYPGSELTFKLIALQYYLDLNETWVNERGDEWDIPRLLREELAQPIRGAACGGTHRLAGLSLTVKNRQRRGEPLDGEYARAAEFVQNYHQYALHLQNSDGSLSTSWFQGRGSNPDIDRRIKTTGHILEWLCYSLSDDELRDPRTVRAVSYLANLMYTNYDHDWEVGPMCHAIHALLLYDERVFQPFDEEAFSVAQAASPAPRRGQPSRRRR